MAKPQIKHLDSNDVDWIMELAHEYISRSNLIASFEHNHLSIATREGDEITSIIVMVLGDGINYVSLLWTNGSYRAIKETMLFFRTLRQTTQLLFHSHNTVLHNHRREIAGEYSGKPYFEMSC